MTTTYSVYIVAPHQRPYSEVLGTSKRDATKVYKEAVARLEGTQFEVCMYRDGDEFMVASNKSDA